MAPRRMGHREGRREHGAVVCPRPIAVFDTSALLLAYEGVDVFWWLELLLDSVPECVVPKPVVDELSRSAASGRWSERAPARLALRLIEARRCRVVEVEGHADDAVIRVASSTPCSVIVTADLELRRRAREAGIPVAYYREERRGFELEA